MWLFDLESEMNILMLITFVGTEGQAAQDQFHMHPGGQRRHYPKPVSEYILFFTKSSLVDIIQEK